MRSSSIGWSRSWTTRRLKAPISSVYPELTLTTFFPRWYHEDRGEADRWFEREMPNGPRHAATLRSGPRQHGMAMSFGYAELTPDGRHFNASILVDKPRAAIIGKYRKVHLPGARRVRSQNGRTSTSRSAISSPGDLGFPVWRFGDGIVGMCICNDRRWPETYRVMGLQGVEMVVLGFNTPSVNSQKGDEGLGEAPVPSTGSRSRPAPTRTRPGWVAVAKAGNEDGHPLFGGSLIVNPDGEIVQEAKTEGDELLVHACDLDDTVFGKETIFDFARHRRIEHYGLITSRVGAEPPMAVAEAE